MKNERKVNDDVRLNLSLTKEFYDLLKQNAEREFVQVGTWTKSFLMKNLIGDKNEIRLSKNEK